MYYEIDMSRNMYYITVNMKSTI